MELVDAALRLRAACEERPFPEVAHVYRPLSYAWEPHERYLRTYGGAGGRVVLVGMNPGPWGMAQTGVPFADVAWAHGWMGITGEVGSEPSAHPKRPVMGYASTRSDPSGRKLYGWAKDHFATAKAFFDTFFVTNYCPLLFLDRDARNVPLPALGKASLARVQEACDPWLRDALDALSPRLVVPLGAFMEAQVRRVAPHVPIHAVRHPSPANPANNAGWGDELQSLVP